MIYFYTGEDSFSRARALVSSLLARRSDAPVFFLDEETATPATLEEILSSTGLFAERSVVYARGISGKKETVAFTLEHADRMVSSAHIFIFAERGENAFSKALSARAEKSVFGRSVPKKEASNIFPLANAFAERRRREAWVRFVVALREGFLPEDIGGTLFWQAKVLMAAKMLGEEKLSQATKAGIKEFPFRKALRSEKNFTLEELRKISSALAQIIPEERSGGMNAELALERILLKL